jgi:hypothetical protein
MQVSFEENQFYLEYSNTTSADKISQYCFHMSFKIIEVAEKFLDRNKSDIV